MTYVRVKQKETGHELSVKSGWADRFADALEFLTDADGNPAKATDAGGDPLPPKYRVTPDEAEAAKVAAGEVPYMKRRKGELEKEIADRNANRPDDQRITVEEPGNKPELAAALDADDNEAPIADPPDGQDLTSASNTTTEEN